MKHPFFCYCGAKFRLAKQLGRPRYQHVVECFAGAAGFSTRFAPTYAKKVTLIEIDPVIFGVWDYLQRATPEEILALPSDIDHIDELPQKVGQEARWLIGLHFNHGNARPQLVRSNWAKQPCNRASFWSETVKYRLAHQGQKIKHWKIIHGSYEDAPDIRDAHWHIDPPYQKSGKNYRYDTINYPELADWCRARPRGFVQVCEGAGATWLPFREYAVLADRHRQGGTTSEWVCEFETEN